MQNPAQDAPADLCEVQKKPRFDRPKLLVILFFLSIIAFYANSIIPCQIDRPHFYYNWLTQGFLSGSLSLPVEVPQALLDLPDPYDPAQNSPYRLHDATLYNGKYYIYFGATPAIVLFLPALALFNIEIPQSDAVLLFICGGFLLSGLLMHHLLKRMIISNLWSKLSLACIVLGFGTAGLLVLLRPSVYEVAISSGYFFCMAALYFLISGTGSSNIAWRIAVGSLCAGLAFGSRPTYIIFAPLLLLFGVFIFKQSQGRSGKSFLKIIWASLFIPFSLCILAVMAYNHARFGSPFEFGTRYMLPGVHANDNPIYHYGDFPKRLIGYIFTTFTFYPEFPYIRLSGHELQGEAMIGLLSRNPIVLMFIPWSILSFLKSSQIVPNERRVIIFLLFGVGVSMLIVLALLSSPITRYHLDYEPVLLIGGLLAWWDLAERFRNNRAILVFLSSTGFIFIGLGTAISLSLSHSETPPAAVYSYTKAIQLKAQDRLTEAALACEDALSIAPDLAIAEYQLALILAKQGKGMDAVKYFLSALESEQSVVAKHKGRSYFRHFQSLTCPDAPMDFYVFLNSLKPLNQFDAAYHALDGYVDFLVLTGRTNEARRVLKNIAALSIKYQLHDFRHKVANRFKQFEQEIASQRYPVSK